MMMKRVVAILLLAQFAVAGARAAASEDPCALVDVPDGLGLACTVEDHAEGGPWRLVVGPTEGPFRHLSRLTIQPVDEPIPRPQDWLRRQVRLDLAEVDETLRDLLESPDNPLGGGLLGSYLETMISLVEAVADAPLVGCGEARTLPGDEGWEVACTWGVGGIEKYQTMRLVERDGRAYLVTVESMNPRRMRHLVAIANSF